MRKNETMKSSRLSKALRIAMLVLAALYCGIAHTNAGKHMGVAGAL